MGRCPCQHCITLSPPSQERGGGWMGRRGRVPCAGVCRKRAGRRRWRGGEEGGGDVRHFRRRGGEAWSPWGAWRGEGGAARGTRRGGVRRGGRGEGDVARATRRGRWGEGDTAKGGNEGDAAGRPGSSIVSRSVNTTAQSSGSAEIPKARRFFLEHFRLAFCVEEMRFAQGAGSGRSERWREGWYKEKGRGRKSGTIKVVQHFQCWSGALWPP